MLIYTNLFLGTQYVYDCLLAFFELKDWAGDPADPSDRGTVFFQLGLRKFDTHGGRLAAQILLSLPIAAAARVGVERSTSLMHPGELRAKAPDDVDGKPEICRRIAQNSQVKVGPAV